MSRDTGFSTATKALIDARSGGVCEIMIPFVCTGRPQEYHHRRPRAMGGTRRADANYASNGVHACRNCHQYAEIHRAEARVNGWLVSQHASPAEVGMLYRGATVLYLTDAGGYGAVPSEGVA